MLHYDTSPWRLPLSDCGYLKRHAQQVLEKAVRDERRYAGVRILMFSAKPDGYKAGKLSPCDFSSSCTLWDERG